MKINKYIVLSLVILLFFNTTSKPRLISIKNNQINNLMTNIIRKTNDSISSSTYNSEYIFNKGIELYINEFPSYLDITGLNVLDKEEIELPNFNINYIAPEFYDIMYSYQFNLEASLDSDQLQKYERLKQLDYNFDKFTILNNIKYTNLNPNLKYIHDLKPINPITPITPLNPDINNDVNIKSISTTAIVTILTSCGLSEMSIAAFTSAISALTAALSTSYIPIIGWVLAILLVAEALLCITVIIVENWNTIKTSIDVIKDWFLEKFNTFSLYINQYFTDAINKGEESTIVGRDTIGGKKIDWTLTKPLEEAIAMAVADKYSTSVHLMRNIKKKIDSNNNYYSSYWITAKIVDENYVTENHLYDLGISTYTWYNNTARRMMQNGGSSLISSDHNEINYKVGYHNFLKTESVTLNGWNHYHIFKKYISDDQKESYFSKIKTGPESKAHSFFGPMYLKTNDNSNYECYPEMRNL